MHLDYHADLVVVNVLFVLGSERLYSDLTRKYSSRTEEPISVIRIDKSGGCVDRDEVYMKALRQAQIRSYFFGTTEEAALNPNSQTADFDDLNIFKVIDTYESEPDTLFRAGDADDDVYGNQKEEIYEKVSPKADMTNSLLAITTASSNDGKEVIRDSSVKGYVYLADVDETKRKVRLLSPQPGQTPSSALIWGPFPEDVAGLV
jgi:polyribonucleotide 5'-hydroxyl-kinase